MLCMGTKKAVTRRRHVRLYNLLFDGAKMRKVFGTCKGEGRKCVAEHVFCGKRKGSRKSMKTCFRCNEKSRTSFEVTGFKIGLRVYLYW